MLAVGLPQEGGLELSGVYVINADGKQINAQFITVLKSQYHPEGCANTNTQSILGDTASLNSRETCFSDLISFGICL